VTGEQLLIGLFILVLIAIAVSSRR